MDEDMISQRINLPTVVRALKERDPGIQEPERFARQMVISLNQHIKSMVNDFERGDGEFSSCYYETKQRSDIS